MASNFAVEERGRKIAKDIYVPNKGGKMANNYIDRDEILISLNDSFQKAHKWEKEAMNDEIRIRAIQAQVTFCEVMLRIKAMSPVDVQEVKLGHWEDVGSLSCRCSECGCKSPKEYRFCPNCGAKIEGE